MKWQWNENGNEWNGMAINENKMKWNWNVNGNVNVRCTVHTLNML